MVKGNDKPVSARNSLAPVPNMEAIESNLNEILSSTKTQYQYLRKYIYI